VLTKLAISPQNHFSSINTTKTSHSHARRPSLIPIHNKPWIPGRIRLSIHLLATKTEFNICLPLINALCKLKMNFSNTLVLDFPLMEANFIKRLKQIVNKFWNHKTSAVRFLQRTWQ
jgi:hypothetical protein